MSFQTEFDKAYEAKHNEDFEIVLLFLEDWEDRADLEHIPYIMRFFYEHTPDDVLNSTVINVLRNIIDKKTEKAIVTIILNISILLQEKADYYIDDIIDLLFEYDDYAGFFADALFYVSIDVRQIILKYLYQDLENKYSSESAKKIIFIYNKLKKEKGSERPIFKGVTKKCPFCAEIIWHEAIFCRFCGRNLPPVDDDN